MKIIDDARARSLRFLRPIRALSAVLLVSCASLAARAEAPRLAVVISLDQFRFDYLERFEPYFGEGGFRRLLSGGTDFTDCHYRHAGTKTAPGHATMLSGVYPNTHGIVANDFLDRATWLSMNAVEDVDSPLVGAVPPAMKLPGGTLDPKSGRSPRNFLATTVGDQLKLRFGDRSKVFSISNKDRAAILMGGKLADGAFWEVDGQIVTSRYYRNELPAWITAFNAAKHMESYFGKPWDRIGDPAAYDRVQGPDDAPGEPDTAVLKRTFPKKIDGGRSSISKDFYDALDNSPFSSEFLELFAEEIVRQEKIGRHEATDLICVGFSQTDFVGHSYGPDSHEMMDSVLRLDRILAGFFAFLDREVGLKHCVIVITADHGAAPMPERVQLTRPSVPAGRVDTAEIDRAVASALDRAFGKPGGNETWVTRDNSGFHLRPTALEQKKVDGATAARVVKETVLGIPCVANAFTRDEVEAEEPEGDALLDAVRRSYFPTRSPDVVVIYKPYFIEKSKTGTTHGMPYDYDNHVPLVFFGAGVPHAARTERVGMEDLAVTLCAILGVPPPPETKGRRLF